VINPKARPCDEAAIRAAECTGTCLDHQKRWVLAVTILSSTMAYVDESVVNVALPAIERDLGTSVVIIQWLVNAYTLSLTALLLVGGAAGDRYGRRRIFVIGTGVFAAASIGCGLSTGVTQLILARAIQGAGAALLIPCSLAIIGASFNEAERGKAIGTWAGFSAISAAIGPLLGGIIVDHASWRWIFLITPFVALPTIWIALRYVPESRIPKPFGSRLASRAGARRVGSLVFGLMAAPERVRARRPGDHHNPRRRALPRSYGRCRSRTPMMPLGLFRCASSAGSIC
jgi:MFS family permease